MLGKMGYPGIALLFVAALFGCLSGLCNARDLFYPEEQIRNGISSSSYSVDEVNRFPFGRDESMTDMAHDDSSFGTSTRGRGRVGRPGDCDHKNRHGKPSSHYFPSEMREDDEFRRFPHEGRQHFAQQRPDDFGGPPTWTDWFKNLFPGF